MSEWRSHYLNEDEEDQDEAEEKEEALNFMGRDSLIFLIDASEDMFEVNRETEMSPFDMVIQCVYKVYTSKVISRDRDFLAVVFFGTQKHKNSVDFKHVYILHDLDTPGARRVLEMEEYQGKEGYENFRKNLGHSRDFSLGDALWACSNLFSDVRVKLSHKRVMLFTNNDNPHANDSSKAHVARTKATDLRETGIILDLMNLWKPGGFDPSLFYRDIVNMSDVEDMGVQLRESAKLDDLLRKVWAKDYKKKAMTRVNLKLGEGVELSVGVFNLIHSARKPSPIRLSRETNEPIKTKTRWFNGETGSLLLPSDIKKAQVYGQRQIVLEKEETEELKRFDNPGLVLIGFKPLYLLKKYHHIRPSLFIYPEEEFITGFHLMTLPFADDIRKIRLAEKVVADQDQIESMKKVVQKLKFKYRPESFENPVIQKHFRNLEALALNRMEPEEMEDLTLPKNDEIDGRICRLAEEFNRLVYPPDYNPDAKGQEKRKLGDAGSGAEKKMKVEVSLEEDEMRQHVLRGTLSKLTVPILKEFCRQRGLKGSRKQELLDAIDNHFAKH
ncbi:X-ray repair cross-complementing protein 6 isoform X2 [Narcine bancroftii]|uniref:X-ray repair cross-complementing protein 6 isoform X2 n=1 Tax=Narcine bancroftii TaxID=1343680 RepID=UPI003831B02A